MCPHALAELGVGACVTPRVQLDRGVAELEALVADVEVLLDGGERVVEAYAGIASR